MPGREHELNEKQTRAKYTLEFKQEAVRQVKAGRRFLTGRPLIPIGAFDRLDLFAHTTPHFAEPTKKPVPAQAGTGLSLDER